MNLSSAVPVPLIPARSACLKVGIVLVIKLVFGYRFFFSVVQAFSTRLYGYLDVAALRSPLFFYRKLFSALIAKNFNLHRSLRIEFTESPEPQKIEFVYQPAVIKISLVCLAKITFEQGIISECHFFVSVKIERIGFSRVVPDECDFIRINRLVVRRINCRDRCEISSAGVCVGEDEKRVRRNP